MKLGPILIFAALAASGTAAQFLLASKRPATAPAAAEGVFAALGGFRSIASEVIWFRADRLQEEGRYVELAQLAHALPLSEPHTPEIWSYAAWNLAYNVSVMMPTAADRWRWVENALTLLRDEGLAYNPKSAELYKELAMLFELKIALDIDDAAAYYREAWRRRVEDVARRGAWEELKMSPAKMFDLERATGMTDRGDPLYSAVYWALEGVPFANRRNGPSLNEVIRQSLVLYSRKHSGER